MFFIDQTRLSSSLLLNYFILILTPRLLNHKLWTRKTSRVIILLFLIVLFRTVVYQIATYITVTHRLVACASVTFILAIVITSLLISCTSIVTNIILCISHIITLYCIFQYLCYYMNSFSSHVLDLYFIHRFILAPLN